MSIKWCKSNTLHKKYMGWQPGINQRISLSFFMFQECGTKATNIVHLKWMNNMLNWMNEFPHGWSFVKWMIFLAIKKWVFASNLDNYNKEFPFLIVFRYLKNKVGISFSLNDKKWGSSWVISNPYEMFLLTLGGITILADFSKCIHSTIKLKAVWGVYNFISSSSS